MTAGHGRNEFANQTTGVLRKKTGLPDYRRASPQAGRSNERWRNNVHQDLFCTSDSHRSSVPAAGNSTSRRADIRFGSNQKTGADGSTIETGSRRFKERR